MYSAWAMRHCPFEDFLIAYLLLRFLRRHNMYDPSAGKDNERELVLTLEKHHCEPSEP